MSLNVSVIQHVSFEGPAAIGQWLSDRGANINYCMLFDGDQLPPPDRDDLVVVMGGPMSVNDEDVYGWLAAEKQFLRRRIEKDLPTLGICLGAQLIAAAMGASVYTGREKEIGWFDIRGADIASDIDAFGFPPQLKVFHWHGETFDLPTTAICLAASDVCRNQAFQIGRCVLALQFHMETTAASAASIIDNCRDDLTDGRYVQNEGQIIAGAEKYCRPANENMAKLLNYILRDMGR